MEFKIHIATSKHQQESKADKVKKYKGPTPALRSVLVPVKFGVGVTDRCRSVLPCARGHLHEVETSGPPPLCDWVQMKGRECV